MRGTYFIKYRHVCRICCNMFDKCIVMLHVQSVLNMTVKVIFDRHINHSVATFIFYYIHNRYKPV